MKVISTKLNMEVFPFQPALRQLKTGWRKQLAGLLWVSGVLTLRRIHHFSELQKRLVRVPFHHANKESGARSLKQYTSCPNFKDNADKAMREVTSLRLFCLHRVEEKISSQNQNCTISTYELINSV